MINAGDKRIIGLCIAITGIIVISAPGLSILGFVSGVWLVIVGVGMTFYGVKEYGSAQAQDLEYEHKDDEKNQGVK